MDAVCGPPRSSLSSKSLAASICITYASGATVCYTIGIHLVGLMTGTKGDDAMRRRDHLRYASLFSLSPFFSPFAFVYRPKYAFILKRYLVSRLDEISVTGTSNRNDSNSFGVFFFFFSESRRTSGGKATEKWTGLSGETRFGPISFPGNIEFRATPRVSTLDIENRLWPIPKTIPDSSSQ